MQAFGWRQLRDFFRQIQNSGEQNAAGSTANATIATQVYSIVDRYLLCI
jgi:hypothetical protein